MLVVFPFTLPTTQFVTNKPCRLESCHLFLIFSMSLSFLSQYKCGVRVDYITPTKRYITRPGRYFVSPETCSSSPPSYCVGGVLTSRHIYRGQLSDRAFFRGHRYLLQRRDAQAADQKTRTHLRVLPFPRLLCIVYSPFYAGDLKHGACGRDPGRIPVA
jgi:hypothetical protein